MAEGSRQERDRVAVGLRTRAFYEGCSFPGYEEIDSPLELSTKARRGIYARLLDEQIPLGSRILDAGCGTGQLAIFLSLMQRQVVGIDFSFNSLKLAQRFKKNFKLGHVQLAQMDLFSLGLKEESFDYIFSNGVLHHTSDARGAFGNLCRLLKPEGYIVIGLYHTCGRLLHDSRKFLIRASGGRFQWLDSFLRQKDIEEGKKRTWYLDQYQNPFERKYSVGQVLAWFQERHIRFINSVPPISMGREFTEKERLFEPQKPGSSIEKMLCQLKWAFTQYREGGFFVMIGRKASLAGAGCSGPPQRRGNQE
jgi:SAM-dependent methyltransferase